MATFFGEVTFRSSRADNDFEDEEYESGATLEKFVSNLNIFGEFTDKINTANTLIISHGVLANEFTKYCLRISSHSKIGEITFSRHDNDSAPEDTGDFHSRTLKPSYLYLSSIGTLVCIISLDTSQSLAYSVTRKVLSLVKSSTPILVLCSNQISKLNNYFDESEDGPYIIYCMQANDEGKLYYPTLPQPSILENVPAAVLTLAIVEDRPCTIYAAFTETETSSDIEFVCDAFSKAIADKLVLPSDKRDFSEADTNLLDERVDRYL